MSHFNGNHKQNIEGECDPNIQKSFFLGKFWQMKVFSQVYVISLNTKLLCCRVTDKAISNTHSLKTFLWKLKYTLFFVRTSKFCLRLAVLNFFSFLRLKCSYFPDWTLQCHKEECQTEYNKNTLFHFLHSFSFKQRT